MTAIATLLLALAGAMFAQAAGADTPPRHLALARELVANIKPADNRYVLGGGAIGFPGDSPASGYAMRADCSGFLLAIFERAEYRTRSSMAFVPSGRRRTRPAAEDFVHSIEHEKGFRRIRSVEELRPGDLVAHAMLDPQDQRQTGTTGHVFLIDSEPQPIAATRPVVEGTRQYAVAIIDSNEEHVGADDSRILDRTTRIAGLGRGTIRLYADAGGELAGWARTFPNTNRFFSYSPRFPSDTKLRKAAMGRVVVER